jgi:hypothetical protein
MMDKGAVPLAICDLFPFAVNIGLNFDGALAICLDVPAACCAGAERAVLGRGNSPLTRA